MAAKHYLPIISDEIYADMVFSEHTFHSIAAVASNVPVLVCGGTAKKYLIPGWRIGWILIHDPIGAFDDEVCAKSHVCLCARVCTSQTWVQLQL